MTQALTPASSDALVASLRALHALGDSCEAAAWRERVMAASGVLNEAIGDTLLGALLLGGTPFATRLSAALSPELDQEARTEQLLQAFFAVAEAGPEGGDAADVLARFGIDGSATAAWDVLRADLLIHVGPLEDVSEAVLAAMRYERWALALAGLERVRSALQARTPRATFGMAAMCLHKLGRYSDADRWVEDGLGADAALIRIPPVFTQDELLRRWGPHERPVVSIVCLTYNHERYVESALRGFLSQDCRHPFEILIHDDASTDATQAIIRDWQARYPAIIKPVLRTENIFSKGGLPLEDLFAQSRGDYVATCEGDDFWIDAHKLQRQVDFLAQHPDVSCTAHNYLHFVESSLTIKPWSRMGRDFYLSRRQLMQIATVLWLPTLMFRRSFAVYPPERQHAAIGDAFLTSFLGTLGRCAYFETWSAAVRRENEFSFWSPLSQRDKEMKRVRTWAALMLMHARLGERQAVDDLRARIAASSLDAPTREAILDEVCCAVQPELAAA